MEPIFNRMIKGALAGFIGGIPMSIALSVMVRLLPIGLRYALPPRQITENLARKTDQEELVDEEAEATVFTGAGHFGYSALTGALYTVSAFNLPLHPILKGSLFGLLVWAGGYLGWLPAVGLYHPAAEQPPARRDMMIIAHLIYGSVTAWVMDMLAKNKTGSSGVYRI